MTSFDERFDVVIIGSGPAGSTYARTIADLRPDASVLMVELGPALPGRRGAHLSELSDTQRPVATLAAQGPEAGAARSEALADLDPDGEFRHAVVDGLHFVDAAPDLAEGEVGLPAASMCTAVGGMGVFWAGSCPRPQQGERVPFIPDADLDAALDRAEVLLDVSKFVDVPGLPGAVRAAAAELFEQPGSSPVGFMPVAARLADSPPHLSGTAAILGDIEATAPHFALRPETLARRVLTRDGAAVGVELEDRRTGAVTRVSAARVAVCADALRTPQVLFASGIRPRALGHHLNDHFQMITRFTLSDEFDAGLHPDHPDAVGYVLIPFSDARGMQGGVIPLLHSPYKLAFPTAPPRLALAAWYGAKDIQFSDAVEFSDAETDFYGMPKMAIRYSHTAADLRTVEQMRQNTIQTIERLGTPTEEPALDVGGASLHYQGTTRMGATDDGTSVCDSYSRVWGVEHLYVGGNGVIPTATASNPTLTTVALAHRAATKLAQDLD